MTETRRIVIVDSPEYALGGDERDWLTERFGVSIEEVVAHIPLANESLRTLRTEIDRLESTGDAQVVAVVSGAPPWIFEIWAAALRRITFLHSEFRRVHLSQVVIVQLMQDKNGFRHTNVFYCTKCRAIPLAKLTPAVRLVS